LAGMLALLVFVAFPRSGALEIAWFRVAVGAVGIVALTGLTLRTLPAVNAADLVRAMVRPLLASVIMALVVWAGASTVAQSPHWLRLILEVAVGAVVYPCALYGLWRIAGRPSGAEQWLLGRARSILGRSASA